MNAKKFIIFFSFLVFVSQFLGGQYDISFTISSFPNDTLIFGHYFSESIVVKDTFLTDSRGEARIWGEESLPGGMYAVFFPDRKRFDILIDTDQEFSIRTDTLDLVMNTHVKGSEDNTVFYDYLSFLQSMRDKNIALHEQLKTASSGPDSSSIREEMSRINARVEEYVQDKIDSHKDLFVSDFLLSVKEVEVPDPPKNEKGEVRDPSFQRRYFKKHYFDHFDLSDPRLLRTPMYEKKLKAYINNLVYPHQDSVIVEVDRLIGKSRKDTTVFKYMLTTLFNHYASSQYIGMDAVYAHIAEKYYIPEASWSDREFIERLRERVASIKPLLIGKVAPDIQLVAVDDMHFQMAEGDTALKRNPYVGSFFNLHQINADYILLYFWESDCGHCKKTVPQLHELYNSLKEKNRDVKFISVSMLGGIEGKVKWIDFINDKQLFGWINAWNPYDFSYKDAYNLTSSNVLYLLDAEKRILSKRITPEQAEKILELEYSKVSHEIKPGSSDN